MSRDYKRKERIYEEEAVLSEEETMEPETRNGVIVGAPNINIRSEPSLESAVVVTVSEGTNVRILDEKGVFFHVRYVAKEKAPEVRGYVLTKYCKEVTT